MSGTRDLTRIELSVVLIAVLIAASLWVLRPFLLATVWATMIVVATWPLMLGVQKRVGAALAGGGSDDRRDAGPRSSRRSSLAIQAIVSNLDTIKDGRSGSRRHGFRCRPIGSAGSRSSARGSPSWSALAAASREELAARFGPYVADVGQVHRREFGSFGRSRSRCC